MKKIAVLTGAGISAESGINTFRDADGLWEGHDVMEVASPQGFKNNPNLVLDFYNERRRQLLEVEPNKAHYNLAQLEEKYTVDIITQNVDNLHERAGSTRVTHLHGELLKARSSKNANHIFDCYTDIKLGDLASDGSQIRPHIVWFGEEVTMIDKACEIVKQADIIVVIGTSMQVYPASNLLGYSSCCIPKFFIDPKPAVTENMYGNLTIISDIASIGTDKLSVLLEGL